MKRHGTCRKPNSYESLCLDPALHSNEDDDSQEPEYTTMHTPEGEEELYWIGQGARAVVYQSPTGDVYAFIGKKNQDKVIAEAVHTRLPDNPHVPAVRRLGQTVQGDVLYTMPFYTVPPESEESEADIDILKSCERSRGRGRGRILAAQGREALEQTLDCTREDLSPAVQEALEELVAEALHRSPTFGLEFQRSNLGEDENGNLVLLDVLVDDV